MSLKSLPVLFSIVIAFGSAVFGAKSVLSPTDVIDHLNTTIAWYQHVSTVDESTSAPQNLLLQDNVRQSAKQVVQTAFAFARAQAAYITNTSKHEETSTAVSSGQAGSVEQVAATANDRVQNLQSQIDEINQQLEKAHGKTRVTLQSQRDTLLADLSLAKEAQSALKNMLSFASTSDATGGLIGQINFLQNSDSIPVALNNATGSATASHLTQPAGFHPESAGIITLLTNALTLVHARTQIKALIDDTDKLDAETTKLADPLRSTIKNLLAKGDTLAKAAENGQTDPAQLDAARKQLNEFTTQFKLLSGPILPLREQGLALSGTRGGLEQWRSALTEQLNSSLGYLAFRLGTLAAILVGILIVSDVFRRATLKYVRDARRRRQFVLIRRILVGTAISLVAAITFFSGFGSVATIAGFVTAGLAVALQNVILSVVAYFFLIGRYGLKAGDRVTVTGVTGDVIEVGLVRLSLLELSGSGVDLHSTGRVAVFSNSVIFQPSPLIRQAPGTDYAWHNITTVLVTGTDLETARMRLEKAVESVFNGYRDAVETQHRISEQTANIQLATPVPVSRARYTEGGVEVVVRYPVELSDMASVDERMINSVVGETNREPKLELASGGFPKVTAA